MRRLDVVTVKGSEVPTGIYTYDALQDQVFLEDKQGRHQVTRYCSLLIAVGMATGDVDSIVAPAYITYCYTYKRTFFSLFLYI